MFLLSEHFLTFCKKLTFAVRGACTSSSGHFRDQIIALRHVQIELRLHVHNRQAPLQGSIECHAVACLPHLPQNMSSSLDDLLRMLSIMRTKHYWTGKMSVTSRHSKLLIES